MQPFFIGENLAFVNIRMKRILNIAKGRVVRHEAYAIICQFLNPIAAALDKQHSNARSKAARVTEGIAKQAQIPSQRTW